MRPVKVCVRARPRDCIVGNLPRRLDGILLIAWELYLLNVVACLPAGRGASTGDLQPPTADPAPGQFFGSQPLIGQICQPQQSPGHSPKPTSPTQCAHKLLIKTKTQAPKRSTCWRDIAAPWQQKFIEFKSGRESLSLFSKGYCILLKT